MVEICHSGHPATCVSQGHQAVSPLNELGALHLQFKFAAEHEMQVSGHLLLAAGVILAKPVQLDKITCLKPCLVYLPADSMFAAKRRALYSMPMIASSEGAEYPASS